MVASCVSHSLHSLLQHLSRFISLAFVLPMLSSLNSLLNSHLYTISHLQSSNRGEEAGSTEIFKKGRKQGVEDGRPIPVPYRPVPVPCRPEGPSAVVLHAPLLSPRWSPQPLGWSPLLPQRIPLSLRWNLLWRRGWSPLSPSSSLLSIYLSRPSQVTIQMSTGCL